jgi:cytoskeletal protein RodZ
MHIPKKTIGFIALGVAILGLAGVGLEKAHVINLFSEDPQKQEQKYNNDRKAATINNNGNPTPSTNTGPKEGNAGTYTPPTNSDNITLTAKQTDDQHVLVTTQLKGYSDGSCTLTLANGSQTSTQTAPVIYQSQFSTCAGFQVPVSSVGSGKWSITLSVVSGGITTTKSTTLEVR